MPAANSSTGPARSVVGRVTAPVAPSSTLKNRRLPLRANAMMASRLVTSSTAITQVVPGLPRMVEQLERMMGVNVDVVEVGASATEALSKIPANGW